MQLIMSVVFVNDCCFTKKLSVVNLDLKSDEVTDVANECWCGRCEIKNHCIIVVFHHYHLSISVKQS